MISAYDFVEQIQTYTKVFQDVGSTGKLDLILSNITTYVNQMPAVYVCFKDETVDSADAFIQAYAECNATFVCYVVLDNSVDTTGAQASQIDRVNCQKDLLACLYNWTPSSYPMIKPVEYAGSQFVTFTGSRAIYAYSFVATYQITGEEQGFIPNYQNLQEIDVDNLE